MPQRYPFTVDGLFLVLMFGKYTVSAYCCRGHRPVDLQALIQRVKNFIGQWTDTALRAILVVVVGQLARDLFTVHTVADMPSALGLVDVSLLHVGNLSDQG